MREPVFDHARRSPLQPIKALTRPRCGNSRGAIDASVSGFSSLVKALPALLWTTPCPTVCDPQDAGEPFSPVANSSHVH